MLYAFTYPFFPEIYSTYRVSNPVNWEQIYTEDVLIFVLEGNPVFHVNNDVYRLSKGDMLYTRAGEKVNRIVSPDTPLDLHYLHIKIPSGSCITATPKMLENASAAKRFGVKRSNRDSVIFMEDCHRLREEFTYIRSLLAQIHQNDWLSQPGYTYTNNALLMLIFGTVSTQIITEQATPLFHLPPSVQPNRKIEHFTNYIFNNIGEKLTLQSLCEAFHFTPQYIIRLFKKYLNTTPQKYINTIKILYAKEIMRRGDISVKEVARIVGFERQHYFSKVFQSVAGCTPSEYKNALFRKRAPAEEPNET